jgi:chaperonin GroES
MSATLAPPPPPNGISSIAALAGGTGASPPISSEPDDHPNPELRDQLTRWVGMKNIAADPDDNMEPNPEIGDDIARIAARVRSDYDIDELSRADWREKYRKWLDCALQVTEHKTYPWPEACFSLDTDVLTDSGWKPVAEIAIGERVLSRAPSGAAAFYPVTERHRFTALSMVHFTGKSIDLMVTPNHRMLVESKFGKRKKQHFIEAGRFLEERLAFRYIPLTSQWTGDPLSEIHGVSAEAYARFLGWYISEGSAFTGHNTHTLKDGTFRDYGKSPSSFAIAQSQTANPVKFERLRHDIEACRFTCKATPTGYIVHARSMPNAAKDELRSLGLSHQKHVPDYLLTASVPVLKALLDGLMAGDGCIRERNGKEESWSYSTVSRRLSDQMQDICQKIGWRATVAERAAVVGGVINGRQITGAQTCYLIAINRKSRIQVVKMDRQAVFGPCEVACVTVEPHHTLYVRRNGKALWCGNSNVIYPLMTTAAIQFAARAYPAIIRDRNVVKGTVIGDDKGVINPAFVHLLQAAHAHDQAMAQQQQQGGQPPPGGPPPGAQPPGPGPMQQSGPAASPQPGPGMPPPGQAGPGMGLPAGMPRQWLEEPGAKQKRALRIGRHMSWQLLFEQEEWEPQTDTLLVALPIVGTYFRKSYYDQSLGRNVSETVDALALCVNYYAKSFETSPRKTESIRMYPDEIETAIRSGLFIDWDGDGALAYGHDSGVTMEDEKRRDPNSQQDEDAAVTFLEQHRRWDLDGDGYPEPYIITVARDSGKLARIVAGFEMDGVHFNRKGQVRKIDVVAVYTKYGFIPNPDSKVYDLGFGHLLFPINEAVNTTINMMIDSGHLQIVGGGFIGSGLSINTGTVRFTHGEYKPVNTFGGNIRDNIYQIPFPGPNPILMQLLQFLIESGERVASVKDVMVGDMPGDNTSGITTLAVIEQGLKVFSAIYKRIHRSLGYEFKKQYQLNRKYSRKESQYQEGGDWKTITREDYEKGAGVEPISDPQMVTDMQRLGRAQFLLTFKDDPRVKGEKIILDAFTAAMIPDAESYMTEAPAQPDPKILLKSRELDIREKREMIELMLRHEHDKALIIGEICKAELALAQARKLDNDAQLGWVEQHIEHLKAQVDAIATLSPPPAGPTADAGGGASPPASP